MIFKCKEWMYIQNDIQMCIQIYVPIEWYSIEWMYIQNDIQMCIQIYAPIEWYMEYMNVYSKWYSNVYSKWYLRNDIQM